MQRTVYQRKMANFISSVMWLQETRCEVPVHPSRYNQFDSACIQIVMYVYVRLEHNISRVMFFALCEIKRVVDFTACLFPDM